MLQCSPCIFELKMFGGTLVVQFDITEPLRFVQDA